MSGWGAGYVTDVEYTRGYYLAQSPHLMAVACLLNGVAVDPPWRDPGLHYLELGCGRGQNASIVAAANPGWRVSAVDFNPGAIADASRIAAAAGLDNVSYIEADLATFAETAAAAALPPVDVISVHGVWSWVAPRVREGIVRLAAAKLRPGGLLHVSYNALPAFQTAIGLQRLMRETGRRLADRSDRQVMAGIEVAVALFDAEARHLAGAAMAREFMERRDRYPVAYLAHEYMNEAWQPCFHAEVAGALAAAKLDFAASARLHENVLDLMLSGPQRAVHDRFDDPLVRQLIIDTCINRTLRHDIYVRGTSRIGAAERDALLREVRIALVASVPDFVYAIDVPAGQATMSRAFYGPMLAALEQGPRSIGELLDLPEIVGRRDNPGEVLSMLVGTSRAALVANPAAGADARIRRYNGVVARRDVRVDALNAPGAMASARLGGGYPCRAVELYLVDRLGAAGGAIAPEVLAAELGAGLDEAGRAELAGVLEQTLRERLQVWRNVGLV